MKRFAFAVGLFVFLLSFAGQAQTIQALIDEGVLVLYHDYRAGHALDLSGQGNDGVLTDTHWLNDGIQTPTNTGRITAADAPELQLITGALVIVAQPENIAAAGTDRLISKRDAGGTNYTMYISTTGISVYDGAAISNVITANVLGAKYIAANLNAAGTAPEIFIDGISEGLGAAVQTYTADNADLTINSNWVGNRTYKSPTQAVLIVNRPLTATEHATLYAELVNLTWPKKPTVQARPGLGAELLVDGNMEAVGVGAWTVGNAATLTKETNRALAQDQVLRVAHNGTADPYAAQTILTAGEVERFSGWARGDATGVPQVLTGATVLWVGTNAVTWQKYDVTIPASATDMRLLCNIAVAGFCEFDNVTAQQVYQTQTQHKTDWHTGVSEANVVAGYIEGTQFQRQTGTWVVTTDIIDGQRVKVIECIGAGILYLDARLLRGDPTQDAYGTWEFWMSKADASQSTVHFVSDDLVGTNGYMIEARVLETVRVVRSGVAQLFITVADYISPSTWYKYRVTRRQSDGQFTAYIDDTLIDPTGGAGTNPVADTVVTTGNYMVIDLDVGDKISIGDIQGNHALVKRHGVYAP